MIRKAVYSFCSDPFLSRPGYAGFATFEDFLNAWSLSVNLALEHFEKLELVTDNYGKTILVNELNLPFKDVTSNLDSVVQKRIQDFFLDICKAMGIFYTDRTVYSHRL